MSCSQDYPGLTDRLDRQNRSMSSAKYAEKLVFRSSCMVYKINIKINPWCSIDDSTQSKKYNRTCLRYYSL